MMGAELDGNVAVVTGGGSGIGRALCGELARRGARVIAADVDAQGAEETAAGIRAGADGPAAGPKALARRVDVTVPGDVENLIAETVREFGRIDFLFNNAGVSANGEFQDIGPEHWKRILDVNLWGSSTGAGRPTPAWSDRATATSSTPPPWRGSYPAASPPPIPPASTPWWACP